MTGPEMLHRVTGRWLCLLVVILLLGTKNVCPKTKGQKAGLWTKMCRPFFPSVGPLDPDLVFKYELGSCFEFEAYPLGKRNHMHVSFRQWPIVEEPHCKDFIVVNISIQAFNKHAWPFGHFLVSSVEQTPLCHSEDTAIEGEKGTVEKCVELHKLEEVSKNPLNTIGQNPRLARKINFFKYSVKDKKLNAGGVCTTWSYSPRNFSVMAASKLGGISNAKRYFGNFAVTFRAELLIIPTDPKIPTFVHALQTRTFHFNGNYSMDHHLTRCHHSSSKNKNFHQQFFTQDLQLPPAYETLLKTLVAEGKRGNSMQSARAAGSKVTTTLKVGTSTSLSTKASATHKNNVTKPPTSTVKKG